MFQRDFNHEYTVQQPFSGVKKAILVVAVAGFIAVIWYAAANRDDLSSEEVDPALVQAPKSPIKERPDAPGGMDVPHRDKNVFNLLKDDTAPKAAPKEQAAPQGATTQGATKAAKQADNKPTPKKAEALGKQQTATQKSSQERQTQQQEAEKQPVEKEKVAKTATSEESRQQSQPEPRPAPEPKIDAQRGWAVQLGSFRSRKDAKKAINIFNKKFETMLAGLTPAIRSAQLEQGTFHRVSYVGLESSNEARNLCSAFKQRNQGCLHVKLK